MGAPLHEVKPGEPLPGQPQHRWFQNDYFDVFLWYDAAGALCRLQLCYDRFGDEHALTWDREAIRPVHHAVHAGEGFFGHGTSGLLEAARRSPPHSLADQFRDAGNSLPGEARELVLQMLTEEPAS